jgi:hypothetical protein
MRAAFLALILFFAFHVSSPLSAALAQIGGRDRFIAQEPDERLRPLPPVESNEVYVENLGDKSLRFQYWNPADDKWVMVELASGKNLTLSCPKCRNVISLSFHDGVSASRTTLNLGSRYSWRWDSNRWAIGPYQRIQFRRPPRI